MATERQITEITKAVVRSKDRSLERLLVNFTTIDVDFALLKALHIRGISLKILKAIPELTSGDDNNLQLNLIKLQELSDNINHEAPIAASVGAR